MHKKFTIGSWVSLEDIPRRLSVAPPVIAVGDLREKRYWEKRPAFYVCSFSFILRGEGEYRTCGQSRRVVAPCVLTQFPGGVIEYGPDEHWDELFIAYAGEQLNFFRDGGIDLAERPVWRINRIAACMNC